MAMPSAEGRRTSWSTGGCDEAAAEGRLKTLPLLIGMGLPAVGLAWRGVGYGGPVSGYAYSAYDLPYWGWGGWHHGWDHGHWDGHVEVAHADGGWGHGLRGRWLRRAWRRWTWRWWWTWRRWWRPSLTVSTGIGIVPCRNAGAPGRSGLCRPAAGFLVARYLEDPLTKESLMTDRTPPMTHATGAPVVDNTNIQTAGPRGPALLQDIWLIEKLAHFDREVIPERRMHAKGSGRLRHLHGHARTSPAIPRPRSSQRSASRPPMFARFSTVAGERGAADAERDIRGFALKFYTEEGNWDIVGNNTPVFFFRDPLTLLRPQPRDQARSAHRPAQRRQQLGLLDARCPRRCTRSPSS